MRKQRERSVLFDCLCGKVNHNKYGTSSLFVSGARTNLSNALICSLYVRDRKSAALRGAEPSSRTAASVNLRLGWARGACEAVALRARALLAAAVDGRVCDGKYIHDQYDSEYTAVIVGMLLRHVLNGLYVR